MKGEAWTAAEEEEEWKGQSLSGSDLRAKDEKRKKGKGEETEFKK